MEAGLRYIIKNAADRLGVELSVKKADGFGERQIVADAARDKTYFGFSYCGSEYQASISGSDKVAENYAYLLTSLIESSSAADIPLGMNEYLKRIMLGDCSKMQVQKFLAKFNVPEVPCYTIVAEFPKKYSQDIESVLENYSESTLDTPLEVGEGRYALVKFIETAAEEYRSPGEFAEYLSQSITDEIGVTAVLGVGMVVKRLEDLNVSYHQALDALKMRRVFNSKGAVHTYKEYVLIKMLEEVPRSRLQEYQDILVDEEGKEIFGDYDMLNTAEEFLESSLNVSETSRRLFMHRNTLIYRLDKIEKATGLNIKNFSDAVTFRLITILKKILG